MFPRPVHPAPALRPDPGALVGAGGGPPQLPRPRQALPRPGQLLQTQPGEVSAVQCTVQYSTVHYNAVQYSTVQYSAVQ